MNKKTLLIKIFTFLGGLYFFLEFVLPESFLDLQKYHESITIGFITMGSMAVGLGIINLFSLHLNKIFYKKKDYFFSFVLILSLIITLCILSLDWYQDEQIVKKANTFLQLSDFSEVIVKDKKENNKNVLGVSARNQKLLETLREDLKSVDIKNINIKNIKGSDTNKDNNKNNNKDIIRIDNKESDILKVLGSIDTTISKMQNDLESTEYNLILAKQLRRLSVIYKDYLLQLNKSSLIKKLYLFCFDGLFNPLVISMFSLLGFYIATASFSAFKIKSFESFLMMFSALIVILGQVPFGVKIWNGFPALRMWLLRVPSSGAFRAISLGAFIAGLVMALRMWFSLEDGEKGGKN